MGCQLRHFTDQLIVLIVLTNSNLCTNTSFYLSTKQLLIENLAQPCRGWVLYGSFAGNYVGTC